MELSIGVVRVRVVRPTFLDVLVGPTQVNHVLISEGSGPMDIALGDNQVCDITLEGLDAANQAGKFTSPPTWTIDHPEIVTITPAADGVACHVEATIPPTLGAAVLTVTDADDPNVPPLVFNITVQAESVTHLGATISPPVDRPTTP